MSSLALELNARRIAPVQFRIAVKRGWLPGVRRAADEFHVSMALLLAIASRETNLDPRYLTIAGDNGNGYGLTQIDKRSYPDWVKAGKWHNPDECFLKTARIISFSIGHIYGLEGQTLIVTSKGRKYSFVGAKVRSREDVERIAIAGYNQGELWAYYHYSKGNPWDQGTTKGPATKTPDYSADVLCRWEVFSQLLSEVPAA